MSSLGSLAGRAPEQAAVDDQLETVAIVGMAGRFPGAADVDAFWRNLQHGVESIRTFHDDELTAAGVDPALLAHPHYVKAKGALAEIDLFDAAFFGFTPREAELLDPQQRVFLECAWHALEHAGYDPEHFPGAIGVFAGASLNGYLMQIYANPDLLELAGAYQAALSNDKDHLATRVAYKLNLRGPSISVQTSCSTSLVAVHLACQSLLDRESDLALAGGVSIRMPGVAGYLYQEGSIFSPDGHCRVFDASAQGTVEGNGAGIVVLKRLQDALNDGDTIYAVIKGSAINNDGALKVGYTAPSEQGQAEVIAEAQAVAGVTPETISYVEAHGTGTPIGDPIEIAALTSVFQSATDARGWCAIGSVKTNIGHLDAAAGVAGLIKTALALRHQQLPPSLHFTQPNPRTQLAESPFVVNTALRPWPRATEPRRAGVSSFGIGGTNAHVVLEEAPPAEHSLESSDPAAWQLLLLSARTPGALDTATANLAAALSQSSPPRLADVAHTLQVGRRSFAHRRMLVCQAHDAAAEALRNLDPQQVEVGVHEGAAPQVIWLFPGQGAQYVGMSRELYEREPRFRAEVERCAALFAPLLGLDLRDVLYPTAERSADAEQLLAQTRVTQPALFTVEYALAQLWLACGVRPSAMLGHSLGEYVAATLAGVFSLEDAVALVAARGRLMQTMLPGAMLAVPLPEAELRSLLQPEDTHQLSIAAVNGAAQCVLAGVTEAIERVERELTGRGMVCRRVPTLHAFHSPLIDPLVAPFRAEVARVALNPPSIPFISNRSGTWISAQEATDPDYWAGHLRATVRFAAGLDTLLGAVDAPANLVLLEVGPGQTLGGLVRHHPALRTTQRVLHSLRHREERQPDDAYLLRTLGRLWLHGVAIDWTAFASDQQRQRVPLPGYPFERQRYWVPERTVPQEVVATPSTLSKRPDISDWFYAPLWQESPLPALPVDVGQASGWLIFVDRCGVGERLAQRLTVADQRPVTVEPGAGFARLDERRYAIDPLQRADYGRLLGELRSQSLLPTSIVHCWGITSPAERADGDAMEALGYESLICLAQALGEQASSAPLRLGVLSSALHEVTGAEQLCPEKALLLGPCRVIPQEYPHITCQNIDVEPFAPGTRQAARLVELLIAELASPPSDPVVVYRGTHRWTPQIQPIRLDYTPGQATPLRTNGVYLLTDGLSVIGLALAAYLAQSVQARLVLLSATPLPDQASWSQWLTVHPADDPTARTLRQLQQIIEGGAELLIVNADVADVAQMVDALGRVEARFGALHGVIHTAATPGAGLIQLKTPAMSAEVLRPKLQGTRVLARLLEDRPLDLLVLFGATTALTGGVGLVADTAANAFLDAFARDYSARTGTPTIAVDWGQWQWADWQDAALTALPQLQQQLSHLRTTYGMSVAECVAALSYVLASPLPQVIVSPQDFAAVLDQLSQLTTANLFATLGGATAGSTPLRAGSTRSYVAPTNEIEQVVAGIWSDFFGIEQIGIHDNFFDLGGSSLVAIQLVARLRETFAIELPMSSLFESPTVAALAALIAEQQLDQDELANLDLLLSEIEDLTPEQLRATLSAETEGQGEL